MSQEIIVAVDFGSSKLKAMAAVKEKNDKLHILGVETDAAQSTVQNGIIVRPSEMAGKLKRAIELLGNRISAPISKFYMPLNARSVRTSKIAYSVKFPTKKAVEEPVLKKLKEEALNTEVPNKTVIYAYPKDFLVDGKPTQNPFGSVCDQLIGNYLIASAKNEVSENIEKCIERSGLVCEEKVLAPLAESMAVLTDDEMEKGCVLLNFGGGTTSVAIFKKGILEHFAVVPFGGKNLTSDLCSLKIKTFDAEQLKKQFGTATELPDMQNVNIALPANDLDEKNRFVSNHDVTAILEARLREILTFVDKELENYGSKNELSAGVVITGEALRLKGIDVLTQKMLKMSVRFGSCANHLDKESQKYNLPEYSLLIGLLLYGDADCTQTEEKTKIPKKNSFFSKVKTNMGSLFEETPLN